MSLRIKVVGLLLLLFLGFAALHQAVQELVIYPGFVRLEREETVKNAERALIALERELDLLVPSVTDWASWDETYQFLGDLDQAYVEANLGAHTLKALELHTMGIYDRKGRIVWGMTHRPPSGDGGAPALVALKGSPDQELLRPVVSDQPFSGIVLSESGPLLVVSRPVLTSDGEGPARGSLLMARLLDPQAITRLAAQARADLTVSVPQVPDQTEASSVRPRSIAQSEIRLVGGGGITVGQVTVMDVRGAPALHLQVKPPLIAAGGREALRFATVSMVLAGCLVLLLMLVGMRRSLLDPISELTTRALLVGSRQDLDVRLNSQRRDELGLLAREFDRMVERLAEARQQLVEQSYKSGIAEMASGVLHNIGNALTPLGVKLGNLKAALAAAPVDEVGLAAAELSEVGSEVGTDVARRADMQIFLSLAGKELAELVGRARRDLEEIQANVDHIQQILADQHRFSRAERVIEPVALAPLVQETVALLPDALHAVARIELGPGLERVGPVRAARVALQQVVSNLLINAAEAIAADGDRPLPGRVRVIAGETVFEGVPMVHLRFMDDGIGIAAENLSRIFQRGFSTKSRGSGTGLHWSANTIQTLGGRLFAESDGPGRGACFNLLLPRAARSSQSLQEAA